MAVIEQAPLYSFHLFLVLPPEEFLYPMNHVLEVLPQFVRVRIVLMESHIFLYCQALLVRYPTKCRFKVVLTNRRAVHKVRTDAISHTASLGETAFGLRHPRTRIDGIAYFLLFEFLAGYVDALEPFQFLLIGAGTSMNKVIYLFIPFVQNHLSIFIK